MAITTRFHAALWATVAWATLGAAALDEASADVVSLQKDGSGYNHHDAFVRNDGATNANANNNSSRILTGAIIGAGANPSGPGRAIYSFPLAGIPAGATIDSVTFVIHLGEEDGSSIDTDRLAELRTISESFDETTATWNNTFGSTMALGTTVLSSTTMDPRFTLPVGGYPKPSYTFASTTNLVAAVQSSLNANEPFNFALVLEPTVEAGTERAVFRMVSNNSTAMGDTVLRPKLTISYTAVPEASSFALFSLVASAVGVGGMVARKRRAATEAVT